VTRLGACAVAGVSQGSPYGDVGQMRCAGSQTVPAQQSCIFVPDARARPWARFEFVPGRHWRDGRAAREPAISLACNVRTLPARVGTP